mgnify:FL=1
MCFLTAWNTDVGVRKKNNQDGLLIKTAQSTTGNVGMFVVCDGMGGLSLGELASSSLIVRISTWFEKKLPEILLLNDRDNKIKESFKKEIIDANKSLEVYGKENGLKIGTTICALLIIGEKYYIFHVGDSRIYKINTEVKQMTEDQTFVNREMKLGRMSEEEAKVHPKKHMLIECVGVTPSINILVYEGEVKKDDVFIISSDGFYSKIKEAEFLTEFSPSNMESEDDMSNTLKKLTELVKGRNEKDNISVIAIKIK